MRAFFALLLVFSTAACSRGDSWAPPSLKIVASRDGTALLRIAPNFLENESSRALATVLKYDATSGGYRKVVEFPLRNHSAPHEAVITNDARFIVTFDDWASIGRTENVVVVYRGDGEFVRAWKLDDIFTPEERKRFVSSTTSIWWRGDIVLFESRSQGPIIFIQPETRITELEKDRKTGREVLFYVDNMTFQKK